MSKIGTVCVAHQQDGLHRIKILTMNVSIFSRQAIEQLINNDFPNNVAVISFFDPKTSKGYGNCTPVDFKNKCQRIFFVCIHDIDIEILGNYGLTFETYFPEVYALAEFILKAKQDGFDIICQCEYGQSRSAACAAAILEYFIIIALRYLLIIVIIQIS